MLFKIIEKLGLKKNKVEEFTDDFVNKLTNEMSDLTDSEIVEILNGTKDRVKKYLDKKNNNLSNELTDTKKALSMLMNPNVINKENLNEDNTTN